MTLKLHKRKNKNVYEYSQSWRKRLRLQLLVDIAKQELNSGKEFDDLSARLDEEMYSRWRLVSSTRKQYLEIVKKVLDDQFVLVR